MLHPPAIVQLIIQRRLDHLRLHIARQFQRTRDIQPVQAQDHIRLAQHRARRIVNEEGRFAAMLRVIRREGRPVPDIRQNLRPSALAFFGRSAARATPSAEGAAGGDGW